MADLILTPVLDLAELGAKGPLAAFNVAPDEALWVAFCLTPGSDREVDASGAAWPRSRAEVPRDYDVFECPVDGPTNRVRIVAEPYVVHHVHPLVDQLLLASGRSRRRSDVDIDHNGRLYQLDGSLKRELLLGDGIQALQATASGLIWVSYFDEGVFGNFGWTQPLGSSGLVAWDATGEKRFEFTPSGELEPISDCYGLNVVSDVEAWLYYYTPFSLVRLESFCITGQWAIPVSGCRAFAVANDHVLLKGGYEHPHDLVLCSLGADGSAKVVSRVHPRTSAGDPITASSAVGRADSLHLVDGRYVYRVRVSDLME